MKLTKVILSLSYQIDNMKYSNVRNNLANFIRSEWEFRSLLEREFNFKSFLKREVIQCNEKLMIY